MFQYKQIYQRLYETNKNDERFCLICNKKLEEENTLESLFIQDKKICKECEKQFIIHRKIYKIDGIDWYVLYEYNEFLERLFFRYKDQKDIVLKNLFECSTLTSLMNRYIVCIPPSSDEKRMERAFEPLIEILNNEVYSPLYKEKSMKQSSQSFIKRKEIEHIIQRKELYSIPDKPILLVDDVCTSGSTLNRCIELLKPKKVFVFAAHPLWIESKQLEKQKSF